MDRGAWWVTVHGGCAESDTTFTFTLSMEAAAAAKSLQSCPTLCDPIDGSPLGSSVPGILQTRILKWVAISFSNAWKWKVKVKSLSHTQLLATPWTGAYQAPPSMGFSRQEYWSGVPLPSPSMEAEVSIYSRIQPLQGRRYLLEWWQYEANGQRPIRGPNYCFIQKNVLDVFCCQICVNYWTLC